MPLAPFLRDVLKDWLARKRRSPSLDEFRAARLLGLKDHRPGLLVGPCEAPALMAETHCPVVDEVVVVAGQLLSLPAD